MQSDLEDRGIGTGFPAQWRVMSLYERFEQIVALVVSTIIAIIVVVSLLQLIGTVALLLVTNVLRPLDHAVFQRLFGMIMTLLIAMEFKHSILRVALRRGSIIQVRTVILIALIALSRKFVILDVAVTDAGMIAALSGAILAMGVVYWLLRDRNERTADPRQRRAGAQSPVVGGE